VRSQHERERDVKSIWFAVALVPLRNPGEIPFPHRPPPPNTGPEEYRRDARATPHFCSYRLTYVPASFQLAFTHMYRQHTYIQYVPAVFPSSYTSRAQVNKRPEKAQPSQQSSTQSRPRWIGLSEIGALLRRLGLQTSLKYIHIHIRKLLLHAKEHTYLVLGFTTASISSITKLLGDVSTLESPATGL
jgi:hypothetical protein